MDIEPVIFTVPAKTSSPIFFWMGMDSPVMADSSMVLPPFTTTPSAATRSPGLTKMTFPISNWEPSSFALHLIRVRLLLAAIP